jgi:hypothetical protein
MMLPIRKLLWTGLVGLWVTSVAAQADCPAIVQTALDATDAACVGTGRNQACYGNIDLSVVPQEGSPPFDFDAPGDIVDVAGVRSLELEPLDAASDIWGIALLRLQANIPETLPGQNVTFLLFGDVEIRNAVEGNLEPAIVNVTVSGNINVRGGPSSGDERVGALADGETVVADGQSPDGTWLRIQLADSTSGWVSADLVTADGDVSLLTVVDPLALPPPPLTPMQAFYFQTGINDAPCEEAPDSGILIQTPEGAGQISFTVNDVNIQLGSTAYLQAQSDGEMMVNVIEHQATVSAQGVTQSVPAGSRVRVPLDANLSADGPPTEPEPYDNADLAALPVGHLPRIIAVARALTQAELDALTAGALPVSGEWFYESPTASLTGTCDSTMPDDPPPSRDIILDVTDAFSAETILRAISPNYDFPDDALYQNPEPGSYTADYTEASGTVFHLEVQFTSATEAEGSTALNFGSCTFATTFTLTAQ